MHPSGFRQSPYADLKPPGEDTKTAARKEGAKAPRKLWHSSPGSSGAISARICVGCGTDPTI